MTWALGPQQSIWNRIRKTSSPAEGLLEVDKPTRRFPPEARESARRKLLMLHDAESLLDLRALPGNRVEALKGSLRGLHSIRINRQWRVVFRWNDGGAGDVAVVADH